MYNIYIMQNIFNNTNNENTTSISHIEQLLDNEIKQNSKEKWNKLDNSMKYKKLMDFVDTYKDLENSNENDKEILRDFLKNALYENQFSKVKDVIYDNNTHIITSIPGLIKVENNYVIQNSKRISTSRNLPKKSFTKKNKNILDK